MEIQSIQTVYESKLPVHEKMQILKSRYENGEGKRVCIVTGTHGDELEGQYICYALGKLFKEHPEKLHGIVDIYPGLNPLGLDSITRGIPTFDLDMNRVFPGNKDGTTVEYQAAAIIDDILGADICIDIHSSNIYLREIPQIRMSVPTAKTLLPYGKMLNVDFIWVHESATVLESTLAHSLNIRGTKTLVVEMGVGMRVTEEYGQQLMTGILNLLHQLGIWEEESGPVREPLISMDGAVGFANSNAAGIFLPEVSHGQSVKKGDVIGRVVDTLTGDVVEEVRAVCDGLVFTLREFPIVYGGSLIARILRF